MQCNIDEKQKLTGDSLTELLFSVNTNQRCLIKKIFFDHSRFSSSWPGMFILFVEAVLVVRFSSGILK